LRGGSNKRLFSRIHEQGLRLNILGQGVGSFVTRRVIQRLLRRAQRGSHDNDRDRRISETAASRQKFALNKAYRRSGSELVAGDVSCLVGINPQIAGIDLRDWRASIV